MLRGPCTSRAGCSFSCCFFFYKFVRSQGIRYKTPAPRGRHRGPETRSGRAEGQTPPLLPLQSPGPSHYVPLPAATTRGVLSQRETAPQDHGQRPGSDGSETARSEQ